MELKLGFVTIIFDKPNPKVLPKYFEIKNLNPKFIEYIPSILMYQSKQNLNPFYLDLKK